MPGFNQKGPMGEGPMTGRRFGRCSNFGATAKKQDASQTEDQKAGLPENFQGPGFGPGRRMGGRGRGMGRMNRFRTE